MPTPILGGNALYTYTGTAVGIIPAISTPANGPDSPGVGQAQVGDATLTVYNLGGCTIQDKSPLTIVIDPMSGAAFVGAGYQSAPGTNPAPNIPTACCCENEQASIPYLLQFTIEDLGGAGPIDGITGTLPVSGLESSFYGIEVPISTPCCPTLSINLSSANIPPLVFSGARSDAIEPAGGWPPNTSDGTFVYAVWPLASNNTTFPFYACEGLQNADSCLVVLQAAGGESSVPNAGGGGGGCSTVLLTGLKGQIGQYYYINNTSAYCSQGGAPLSNKQEGIELLGPGGGQIIWAGNGGDAVAATATQPAMAGMGGFGNAGTGGNGGLGPPGGGFFDYTGGGGGGAGPGGLGFCQGIDPNGMNGGIQQGGLGGGGCGCVGGGGGGGNANNDGSDPGGGGGGGPANGVNAPGGCGVNFYSCQWVLQARVSFGAALSPCSADLAVCQPSICITFGSFTPFNADQPINGSCLQGLSATWIVEESIVNTESGQLCSPDILSIPGFSNPFKFAVTITATPLVNP